MKKMLTIIALLSFFFPFTRSLSGVAIPADIDHVMIRAHDSIHEYGGKTMRVELP